MDLGGDYSSLFKDCEMLTDNRLRLVETAPQVSDAGHILMFDEAENLQANRVPDGFELCRKRF